VIAVECGLLIAGAGACAGPAVACCRNHSPLHPYNEHHQNDSVTADEADRFRNMPLSDFKQLWRGLVEEMLAAELLGSDEGGDDPSGAADALMESDVASVGLRMQRAYSLYVGGARGCQPLWVGRAT